MNFKKLEKAAAILKEIQALDSEIIEIDKLAMIVANGEVKCHFELNVEDISKKNEVNNKVGFDEDGSLIAGTASIYDQIRHAYTFHFNSCQPQNKIPKNDYSIEKDITENATLNILGVLLYEKKTRRDELLKKLEKAGVTS